MRWRVREGVKAKVSYATETVRFSQSSCRKGDGRRDATSVAGRFFLSRPGGGWESGETGLRACAWASCAPGPNETLRHVARPLMHALYGLARLHPHHVQTRGARAVEHQVTSRYTSKDVQFSLDRSERQP